MSPTTRKAVIRKYYFKCFLILLCYLAIVIPCIWVYPNIWSVFFCTALYFLVKIFIRIVANKTIASILFVELDAMSFKEVINGKKFLPPLEYRLDAAMFTGDYQTAVNIAISQIKKRSSIRVKYLYLCILAHIYFELRDFKKLQELLTEYDNYKAKYSSKSFLNQPYSIWSYYRYFLEHNYQACKILCKERNLGLRPKAWDTKLQRLKNDFFYAVACYENQEFEEAEKIFKNIILYAPKIYLSNISQNYLVAIDQGYYSALSDDEILPQSDYQIYDNKTQKRIRNHNLVRRIAVSIVIVLLIVSSILNFSHKEMNKEISNFEKNLNQAVTVHYSDATVIDYFNLYKDESFIDALGILLENNCVHLVEIVSSDEGKTFDISLIEEDIELDKYYCVKSPTSNFYLGFVLSNNSNPGTDIYCVREFTIKSDKYLFIVDYIERWPKSNLIK